MEPDYGYKLYCESFYRTDTYKGEITQVFKIIDIFQTASPFSSVQVNTEELGLRISLAQGLGEIQYQRFISKEVGIIGQYDFGRINSIRNYRVV